MQWCWLGCCGSRWRPPRVRRRSTSRPRSSRDSRNPRGRTPPSGPPTSTARVSAGIPGNVTDTVVDVDGERREPARREQGERVVDGYLADEVADLRGDRLGAGRARRARQRSSATRSRSANDAAGARPARLDAPGLRTTARPGRRSTRRPGRTSPSASRRSEFDVRERPRRTASTGSTSPPTTARASSSWPSWQLSTGDTSPPPPSRTCARASAPGRPARPNIKPGVGLHRPARRCSTAAGTPAPAAATPTTRCFAVDVPVTALDRALLQALPRAPRDGDLQYPSTYAAVDLAFTDGTYLSDLGAADQHGAPLSPRARALQGALRRPVEPQASARRRLRRAARRSSASSSATTTRGGSADTLFGGWVDDIRIARRPRATSAAAPRPTGRSRPAAPTRAASFSRGNNFPATAVPHGFNFWTPVTDAGSMAWLYEYQRDNDDDEPARAAGVLGQPRAEPVDGRPPDLPGDAVRRRPAARRRAAARARCPSATTNEIARPYFYGVTFENGIRAEIAPTDHAAMLRFTLPRRRRAT